MSVPIAQVMLPGAVLQAPWLTAREEIARLSGKESVKLTLVAVAGPLFDTFAFTVILSPTMAVVSEAAAETERSAGSTAVKISDGNANRKLAGEDLHRCSEAPISVAQQ